MAEDDELTLTPILVVDFSPVFGGNGAHDSFLASDARDRAFRDALRATEIVRLQRQPPRAVCQYVVFVSRVLLFNRWMPQSVAR